MDVIRTIFSERNRAYIYRVLVAVGSLSAFYGLITADELPLWLGVAATVLNILPALNTSTKGDE